MQFKQITLELTIGGGSNKQLELAGVNTCKAAEKVYNIFLLNPI